MEGPIARRALPWLFVVVGALAWALAINRAFAVHEFVTSQHPEAWLYDWWVYVAGSNDLLSRTLYEVPLSYPGRSLPVEAFNLPPLAAVWPLLLSWLPPATAGALWVLGGGLLWIGSWLFATARVMEIPHAWAFVGAAALWYSGTPAFTLHLSLGNINDVVLGLIVAFVVLHQREHHSTAGIVLAIAIGTKIWPAALLVLSARERRWRELAWCVGSLSAIAIATIAWLGVDALSNSISALQVRDEVDPANPVLWTTWLREHTDWWPAWGAAVIAAGCVIYPARGILGLGLGILAGLTLVPNIWSHYLPTMVFGLALVAGALFRTRFPGSPRTRGQIQGAPRSPPGQHADGEPV